MLSVRRKGNLKKSNPQDLIFSSLIEIATKAANDAGDKWIEKHTEPVWAVYNADPLTGKREGKCLGTMLDVCGFGFVKVTDKRTAFAKYLKRVQRSWNGEGYNDVVRINLKHNRQELGLNTVMAEAVFNVLYKSGITGIEVYSRID